MKIYELIAELQKLNQELYCCARICVSDEDYLLTGKGTPQDLMIRVDNGSLGDFFDQPGITFTQDYHLEDSNK